MAHPPCFMVIDGFFLRLILDEQENRTEMSSIE